MTASHSFPDDESLAMTREELARALFESDCWSHGLDKVRPYEGRNTQGYFMAADRMFYFIQKQREIPE